MRTSLAFALLSLAFFSCSTPPGPATKLEKAGVLPLEINDNFQFRKIQQSFFSRDPVPVTQSEPVLFERQRMRWGAVDQLPTGRAIRKLLHLLLARFRARRRNRPAGISPVRPRQLCHGNGTLLSSGERLVQVGVQHSGRRVSGVWPRHFLASSPDRRRSDRCAPAIVYVALMRGGI